MWPGLAQATDASYQSDASYPDGIQPSTTELLLTKHEPEAYRFGRGSMPCRFRPREQHHEVRGDDPGAYFRSASKEYYASIWMDVGPIDDHLYHFRFFSDEGTKLRVGTYYDPQCSADAVAPGTEVGISVTSDPLFRITPNYLRPCTMGGFRVLQAEYDPETGLLANLAIDFQYRGVGVMGDVDGSLRYHASSEFDVPDAPFDLELAQIEGRRAHLDIAKTLSSNADLDDMNVCTITGESEEVEAAASASNPWTPPGDEISPEEVPTALSQVCTSCVHMMSGGGSLDVWGAVACMDLSPGTAIPSAAEMQSFCQATAARPPGTWDPPAPREADTSEPETDPSSPPESEWNEPGSEASDSEPESEWNAHEPEAPDPDPEPEWNAPEPEWAGTETGSEWDSTGSSDPGPGSTGEPGDESIAGRDRPQASDDAPEVARRPIRAPVGEAAAAEPSAPEPRPVVGQVPSGALPLAWAPVKPPVEPAEEEAEVFGEPIAAPPAPDPVDGRRTGAVRAHTEPLRSARAPEAAELPPAAPPRRSDTAQTRAPASASPAVATSTASPAAPADPVATPLPAAASAVRPVAAAPPAPTFDGAALLGSLSELVERVRGIYREWSLSWVQASLGFQ